MQVSSNDANKSKDQLIENSTNTISEMQRTPLNLDKRHEYISNDNDFEQTLTLLKDIQLLNTYFTNIVKMIHHLKNYIGLPR